MQTGAYLVDAAPVSCKLKCTLLPLAGVEKMHPFGLELMRVLKYEASSVVAADLHSAAVSTEDEPVGHTFAPLVPRKYLQPPTEHQWMDGSLSQ